MDLTVTNKTPVAADTVRVTLAATAGGPLAPFEPGAHVELSFAGLSRRYSLTSSPHDPSRYEICVLRTDSTRGGSAYIHDQLRAGDRLQVDGPFNAFRLNHEARHSVFIAGGIGITPFLSMMEALERSSRPFDLHYAARDALRLLPVPDYSGRTNRYPGRQHRLDVDAVLAPLPTDVDLYVCGPHGLIEAVRTRAAARGWPDRLVHFESFGPLLRPTDVPIKIRLALSGLCIEVRPGTTILDALLANGIWAPYECLRGECASCMTEVIAGEPDHRDLCLTADQRRHAMCTCVSWSRTSDIVLNL